jgi:hypothetical protein
MSRDGDLHKNSCVFVGPPDQNQAKAADGVMLRVLQYPQMGIGALNYLLREDPEVVAKLSDRFGMEFDKHWEFWGVLVTKPPRLDDQSDLTPPVLTYVTRGYVEMENVWLACLPSSLSPRRCITEGCVLYFIRRRYRKTSAQLLNSAYMNGTAPAQRPNASATAKNKAVAAIPNNKPVTEADVKQMMASFETEMKSSMGQAFTPVVNEYTRLHEDEKQEEIGQFYWQLDPYVSYDGQPPPPHMYISNDPANPYRGKPYLVGRVLHVYGSNNQTPEQAQYARDVLYAPERSTRYIESLSQLHRIALLVREGGASRCI